MLYDCLIRNIYVYCIFPMVISYLITITTALLQCKCIKYLLLDFSRLSLSLLIAQHALRTRTILRYHLDFT